MVSVAVRLRRRARYAHQPTEGDEYMTGHERQPMPVADAICSSGVRAYYPEPIDELHWAAHIRDTILKRSTRVNFGPAPHQQDILPITHDGETVGAELAVMLRDHVGPQKLPFDDVWFEAVWPRQCGRMG